MKSSKSNTPQAKGWLYGLAYCFCLVVSKLFFRLKVIGRESLPKDGPLLVLCSHQGMMDFLLVLTALRGRTAQFVATQRQFRNPKLNWLYVRMGVIPKVQFHTDPRCVMNIMRVLKKDGTVVIFPAGQTSVWGVPGNIAPSIAHLVKRMNVPVCTVSLRGGFFSAPRLGGLHFGRTEARLDLTFTPQQLQGLEEDAIFRKLEEKLYYDEYAWQEETGVTFRGKELAKNYDHVLVCCPKCGSKGSWKAEEDTVTCTNCGNTARVGNDLHLHPVSDGDKVFPTLKEWYGWQEQQVVEQMSDPDFLLETAVTCRVFEEESFSYRDAGRGVLQLDKQEIRYVGMVDDEPVRLAVRHANLPGLSAEPGEYVELFHEGYDLLRYIPEDKAAVAYMKLAQEYLYRQTL